MVPQLDSSYWFSQIVWLTICLGILVLFFKKVFLPRITSSVSSRDKHIQELKDKVSSLTKLYEKFTQKLTDIDNQRIKETQKIMTETKDRCEKILNEQLKVIDLKSKNAIAEARKDADKLLKNLNETIKAEIDVTTKLVVNKLFGDK